MTAGLREAECLDVTEQSWNLNTGQNSDHSFQVEHFAWHKVLHKYWPLCFFYSVVLVSGIQQNDFIIHMYSKSPTYEWGLILERVH